MTVGLLIQNGHKLFSCFCSIDAVVVLNASMFFLTHVGTENGSQRNSSNDVLNPCMDTYHHRGWIQTRPMKWQ